MVSCTVTWPIQKLLLLREKNKLTEEKSDKSSLTNERGRDTYRSGQLLTSRVLENDSPDAITSIILEILPSPPKILFPLYHK
ncbi:hypothetical protein YC2023_017874 [Brassica napus]